MCFILCRRVGFFPPDKSGSITEGLKSLSGLFSLAFEKGLPKSRSLLKTNTRTCHLNIAFAIYTNTTCTPFLIKVNKPFPIRIIIFFICAAARQKEFWCKSNHLKMSCVSSHYLSFISQTKKIVQFRRNCVSRSQSTCCSQRSLQFLYYVCMHQL